MTDNAGNTGNADNVHNAHNAHNTDETDNTENADTTRNDGTDARRLIASAGTPERVYAHLEPIVEAELSWGNRVRSTWRRLDKLLDDRTLSLRDPLHVDLIKQTFRFPGTVQMWAVLPRPGHREKGRLLISDTTAFVTVDSPLPQDWTYAGRIEW